VTITATGGTNPYTGTGVFNVGAGLHNYIVFDSYACFDTLSVSVDTLLCTSIHENNRNENKVFAYPNPNNGTFKLHGGQNENYMLINQTGQLIREVKFENNAELNVEDLTNGIYFLVGSTTKLKIVVQNN